MRQVQLEGLIKLKTFFNVWQLIKKRISKIPILGIVDVKSNEISQGKHAVDFLVYLFTSRRPFFFFIILENKRYLSILSLKWNFKSIKRNFFAFLRQNYFIKQISLWRKFKNFWLFEVKNLFLLIFLKQCYMYIKIPTF